MCINYAFSLSVRGVKSDLWRRRREGRKKNKRRQRKVEEEKKSAEKTDHKQRERRESWPRRNFDQTNERSYPKEEEYKSFVSRALLERFTTSRCSWQQQQHLWKARFFGFKSNNNNFLIDSSSIALPHPKVARYSSHQRAGRREREKERLYLRLREKTTNGALLTKSSSLSPSWLLLLNDIIIDDDWRVVPIGFRAIVAEHTSEQPPRRRRTRRPRCDDSSSSPVDRRRGRKHFKILF